MHHSPFPSHLNSPLSTHLFSCRGDWNRYTKIRHPQGDWRPSLPFSSGQIGFSLPLILPLHLNKRLFPPFTNHFPVQSNKPLCCRRFCLAFIKAKMSASALVSPVSITDPELELASLVELRTIKGCS